MSPAAKRLLVSAALVGVAAVWGATFVMVKDAIASYPTWSFLGVRFAIASVAFLVLFPSTLRRMSVATLRVGLLAGVFLTAGYVLQTLGLARTSPSKAAFITGMFVVITPFMQAVILRRTPRWTAWLGVIAATAGLWLLSGGGSLGGWNTGDTLVFGCAIAYSAHIIVLGSKGRGHDPRPFTWVQLVVAAVVCGAVGVVVEHPGLPSGSSVWLALLVTGVLASAVAFAVQTWAQRHLSPTRTALILIMEPAFGGLFGWWLAHEVLGVRGWVGAVLILAGMASSEALAMLATRRGERAVLEPVVEGPPAQVVEAEDPD
jgi:drug/metabolite transporter (DMT)-like permease